MKSNRISAGLLAASLWTLWMAGCDGEPSKSTPATTDSGQTAGENDSSTANDSANSVEPANQLSAGSFADEFADSDSLLRILHWNVESGGNKPETIASQIIDFGPFDILGLSEVHAGQPYVDALEEQYPGRYASVMGKSGVNDERENDHLVIIYDQQRFEIVSSAEMNQAGGFTFDDGRHRIPLNVQLKHRDSGIEFVVVHNHLARGNELFRQAQARGLREWARVKSEPVIAIGDYNFDYVFETRKGNPAFGEFVKDGVWKWIEPEELIDTNWYDPEGDGVDNYEGSMLDFTFVAGAAKQWKAKCRVIVRPGDFPDDDNTSDHRPVETLFLLPTTSD